VPLSEHEQRLLEQMERALYAEDPKFATALEGTRLRTYTRKRVYQAVAGFVLGVVLLMAGVVKQGYWPISVVGFLVMLGCALLAVASWRGAAKAGEVGGSAAGSGSGSAPKAKRRRLGDRMEERWQRRQDEQGR
jgi:hypothetical protein